MDYKNSIAHRIHLYAVEMYDLLLDFSDVEKGKIVDDLELRLEELINKIEGEEWEAF